MMKTTHFHLTFVGYFLLSPLMTFDIRPKDDVADRHRHAKPLGFPTLAGVMTLDDRASSARQSGW